MPTNLLEGIGGATQSTAATPQARKPVNLLAQNYDEQTAGLSHEQIVDLYRTTEDKGLRDHLVKLIEKPQPGETEHQAKLRSAGAPMAGPSKTLSGVAGAADMTTFGLYDEAAAGLDALTGQRTYDQGLDYHRRLLDESASENPGSYTAGAVAGGLGQAAVTLGAANPMTMGGRALLGAGAGGAGGATYGFGSGEGGLGNRAINAGKEGALGVGLGLAPAGIEAIYKGGKAALGAITKPLSRALTPKRAAEKELTRKIVQDWIANERAKKVALERGKPAPATRFLSPDDMAAAEGRGQRTMVYDMGGDATRRTLKAAANVDEDAANRLHSMANLRQTEQQARVNNVLSDSLGDVNPQTVIDDLKAEADRLNDINYRAADNNPKSAHMWNPALQRVLSTTYGQEALNAAIKKSRNKALNDGDEILEPIFAQNDQGLMEFTGKLRKPNGEAADDIQGVGVNLRFWDSIKRSLDDKIENLKSEGFKDEAREVTRMKQRLVNALDAEVPEYATARSTAREFFEAGDAHEMGAKYFTNMNAFDTAAASKELGKMNGAERELFARGFAASMMHKISQGGDTVQVHNLFKSPSARMKMREALGDNLADQLEVVTHTEMVQGLLRTHLNANSTTAAQMMAIEGLKYGATSGASGLGAQVATGNFDIATFLGGAATGAGFRAGNRKIVQRYARQLAELATSDDPEVIARIAQAASKDRGFIRFSRAAAEGLNKTVGGATQGAGRVEPRLPFSKGGLVKRGIEALLDAVSGDGVEAVAKKVKAADDISDMPRIFDLSELDKVPDVEQKPLPRYQPKRGVSERTQDMLKSKKVQRGVSEAIERGAAMGGRRWYNNDPLRREFVDVFGPDDGPSRFRDLMDYVAATSPRSKVPENARNATYYYSKAMKQELPKIGDRNPAPYGHLAQRLHQMNARRVASEGWDALNNPKPASFAENLSGNQTPGTIDTHATRLPAILSGDPRWLAKQLVVVDPETKAKINMSPQKMFAAGDFKMKKAKKRPALWESKPNDNEYGAIEQFYADLGREQGMTTAQAQASAWAGGGDITGLGSVGSDPFIKVFEDRILLTAKRTGLPPREVLRRTIAGEMPLFNKGGRVTVSALQSARSCR